MADLKPCPFCGGEAYQKTAYPCDPDGLELNLYIVGCKNCDIEFSRLWNEKAVIEAWNTRKPMEAMVAELEKEKEIHTEHFRISLYKDYPEIKQMYEKVCLVIDKAISIVRGKE